MGRELPNVFQQWLSRPIDHCWKTFGSFIPIEIDRMSLKAELNPITAKLG